jgi:hypothetical protein
MAAAHAAKDRQFRAFQEELGLSPDNDGEASAPSTPQKASARHLVAQIPQQRDGGAPGKQVAQVELDPSSLVPIPNLPPYLQMLVSNSLGPAGQDARSTKLLESLGPSCSPYIESPPRRLRSREQTRHVVPGTPSPFILQDSNFLAIRGASLEPRNSIPLQVRTKTRAQHAAAALSGIRTSSSLKCVVVSTLQYTMPHNPPQVQGTSPLSSLSLPPDPQDSITPVPLHSTVDSQTENQSPVLPEEGKKVYSPVNNPYVNPPVRQLEVVNKVANTIHFSEDGPTKDCYGWDPMLDGDSDDTNSNQDLDMSDDPTVRLAVTPGG